MNRGDTVISGMWELWLVTMVMVLWGTCLVYYYVGGGVKSGDSYGGDSLSTLNSPGVFLVVEDSTWAETIHWHDDTVCLYNVGKFVCCVDTVDLHYLALEHVCFSDTVKRDSVGPSKFMGFVDRVFSYVGPVVLREWRVIEKVLR